MRNRKTNIGQKENYFNKIFNKNFNKEKNEMEKTENLKNKLREKVNINSKKINFIMIVFIVIILFLAGCSIGKSITDIILVSEIEVAKPILEVKSNPEIDVTASNNIGEYEFRVLNYNEKELSELILMVLFTV